MKSFTNTALIWLASIWIGAAPAFAAVSERPPSPVLPQPSVDLKPEDVVRTVIAALAQNDKPFTDAGITTTFGFASPANKVNTGPLEKFINMVKAEPYGLMVDHVASEFSEVVYTGNNAYMMVNLTGTDGRAIVYAFRLSKQQDGEFKDMWMTDAVWPVANHAVPQQAF